MMRLLLSVIVVIAGFGSAFGQVSLTNAAPTATINFSGSMQSTVGTGAYTGAGFSTSAVTGRLNSNAWETKGWVNGDLLFGGAMSNPSHGRGSVASGVITEGFYAFTDTPASVANPALMIQPSDGDFAPGTLTLKIKNNGTSNMTQLSVTYNLFIRNDENTSSSFNFSHSGDNLVFEPAPELDYISPDVADPLQWGLVDIAPSRSMIISGINVAPGAFYYIRWTGEDVSGTGARDEFGLDDIVLTATYGTPAPEINVLGNTLTILAGDMTPAVPDGTQFANTFTGGSFSVVEYKIQNLGGADLTVSSFTITGTNPGDFTTFVPSGNPAPTGVIAAVSGPVSSRSLFVKFTPGSPGVRSAVINIYSDDTSEPVYSYKVQGLGVVPQPDIDLSGLTAPNTGPIYSTNMIPITSNSTLFSPQAVGGTGEIKDYKIKNNGTAAQLILTNPSPYITIGGANPSDFTLVTIPTGATMNPGFTKTFSIKFNPTAAGIRTAIVTIPNNDIIADFFGGIEGPFTFLIQGTGIAPEMDLTGNLQPIVSGSTIPAFANHTVFDYLNIITGTLDRVFTINNTGTMALSVGALTLTGSSDFTLLTPPAASVAAGSSTSFTIRFNPTTVGPHVGNVSIVNNDSTENPYTFAIIGYGVNYIPCSFGTTETIAVQDFETVAATPVWSYAATGTTSLTSATGFGLSGDGGASNRFLGARSLQVANSSAVVTFATVNTTQYSNIEFNLRVSSMSVNITDGSDVADKVVVAISTNGGTSWINEMEIRGNTDAKWTFSSGTGIANIPYDGNGTAVVFAPSSGGFVTAQAFSTLSITGLPSVAGLRVRVTINNNTANEIWTIDNVSLFGRKEIFSTWDGASWSNGIPTSSVKAIIDGNYDTNINGNLQACKCEIKAGKNVVIQSDDFMSIESNLDNFGTITVENSGSLVQRNDYASNAGIINVKRHTTDMTRYDYTYWSSPVSGQTLYNLSPLTMADKYFIFNPLIPNWQNVSSSTAMLPGTGYIIRAPQTFSISTAAPYTDGQFSGLANNGFITTPIAGGAGAWNLIGNPYPSAIDADLFLGYSLNTGVVGGTIYLWTHNTPVTNNIYTADDYAIYNLTGGVGTAAASSGINNTIPDGNIASGQGFFVTAIADGVATFNNSMRLTGNNNEFFRASDIEVTAVGAPDEEEKNRVWLNMSNSLGAFKQTLVGYIEGASNDLDRDFDGSILEGGNTISFYSLLNENQLAIQGRRLPFETTDVVKLGYVSNIAGSFEIKIEKTDGFLQDQPIYLEDKQLNIIHDLKALPYNFTTVAGSFNDRFELRYNTETLSVGEMDLGNGIQVAVKNKKISIHSSDSPIESVAIYDLLGRLLLTRNDSGNSDIVIDDLVSSDQALIVKIKLSDGTLFDRKIVF